MISGDIVPPIYRNASGSSFWDLHWTGCRVWESLCGVFHSGMVLPAAGGWDGDA